MTQIKVTYHPTHWLWGCGMMECQHPEIIVEETEVDTMDNNGEHTTYPSLLAYCADCDECIEDYDFIDKGRYGGKEYEDVI